MSDPKDDFFVGYFKMSARSRNVSLAFGIGLILLGLGVGVAVVLTQQNPGAGLDPHKSGQTFRGIVLNKPYPHMRYLDGSKKVRTVLFTSSGKSGITPVEQEGEILLRASGTLLRRDEGRILAGPSFETVPDEDRLLLKRLQSATDEELGDVELKGEIVDSKCYYGAMRPGGGRGHRACAQMCISGGIPPVFILRHAEGEETHVLLCSLDEEPVNDEVLPYVAEPVAITGRLIRRAGMLILKFDPDRIERL